MLNGVMKNLLHFGADHCEMRHFFHIFVDDYLQLLPPVALGAVPLHYGFPHIQQEYISIVKAVPWHLHLHMEWRRVTRLLNFIQHEMPHNHRTPNTYNNRYDKCTIICSGGSADTLCSSAVWRLQSSPGGGAKMTPSVPDMGLYILLSLPLLPWHVSSLWHEAIAGCCRRWCPRGQNPRLLHPSCSCGRVKNQSSSAIKASGLEAGWMQKQLKAFLVLFVFK